MDMKDMPAEQVDKMFTILRPLQAPMVKHTKTRIKSVSDMKSIVELQAFMDNSWQPGIGMSTFVDESPCLSVEEIRGASPLPLVAVVTASTSKDTLNTATLPGLVYHNTAETAMSAATGYRNKDQVELFLCTEVSEGCILGIGALRGRAGIPNAWRWVDRADMAAHGISDVNVEMAEVPFTVEATTNMECATFSVQTFEQLFGPLSKAFSTDGGSSQDPAFVDFPDRKGVSFDVTKFKIIAVLGSGSFGTVTLAEYDDGAVASPNKDSAHSLCSSRQPKLYALKSLSKVAIIETGQQRHVMDEKKLLFQMDNPFIIKLYGVYQTLHQLIMVTEAVECGDLWGVIYEEELVKQSGGIPCRLAQFYSAMLICALEHTHSKNIAYRDLKVRCASICSYTH